VQLPRLKGLPHQGRRLEQQLRACRGIENVVANAATGSLLVEYDANCGGPEHVIRELRRLGWAPRVRNLREVETAGSAGGVKQKVAESVVASVLELAVRGLVSALV
jgi:hypothetical protein